MYHTNQAVSTALNKQWNFATHNFRRYTLKKDGGAKYDPSLKYKVKMVLHSTPLSVSKLYLD